VENAPGVGCVRHSRSTPYVGFGFRERLPKTERRQELKVFTVVREQQSALAIDHGKRINLRFPVTTKHCQALVYWPLK
jgi:hypothetical protein